MPAGWTTITTRVRRIWRWRWGETQGRKDGKTQGEGPPTESGAPFHRLRPCVFASLRPPLPTINRVKQELIRPMRLAPEGDLRGAEEERALAPLGLGPADP